MNLAGDLLIAEQRRQRRAGARVVAMPRAPVVSFAEPIEVVACAKPTSTNVMIGKTRYEAGQTLRLGGEQLLAFLAEGRVWIPNDLDVFGAPGRILMAEPGTAAPLAHAAVPGSLRIVQGCAYDPGNAVYRYHTAVNEHTKHGSTFVKFGGSNPFQCPTQIDGAANLEDARAAIWHADVVHHHVDYYLTGAGFGPKPRSEQLVVRHYHGSLPPKAGTIQHCLQLANRRKDDALGAVLLGARLTLCALRPDRMQWLPIPVPVLRYRALVPATRTPGPFRIAHSPTKVSQTGGTRPQDGEYKGTRVFLDVCDRLTKRGVAVEPVLIGMKRQRGKLEPARKSHAEALAIKARCDAVFDSFWLGPQGSGLEGGAMGLPCIAGDPDVADLYRDAIGYVPYTFANDAAQLEQAIERLVLDVPYRTDQATRFGLYVEDYHDYRQVAKRYESILVKALGREDVRT